MSYLDDRAEGANGDLCNLPQVRVMAERQKFAAPVRAFGSVVAGVLLLGLLAAPAMGRSRACPAPPAEYRGRYSDAVGRRAAAFRPWVELLAGAYQIDSAETAAVLALETGYRSIRGGIDRGCFGAGQVRWQDQAELLCREGISCHPGALLNPWIGIWAAVRVLAGWHRIMGPGALCAYTGATEGRCRAYRAGVAWMRCELRQADR